MTNTKKYTMDFGLSSLCNLLIRLISIYVIHIYIYKGYDKILMLPLMPKTTLKKVRIGLLRVYIRQLIHSITI